MAGVDQRVRHASRPPQDGNKRLIVLVASALVAVVALVAGLLIVQARGTTGGTPTQPPANPTEEAAVRLGWTDKLVDRDEFNTGTTLDPSRWTIYNGRGTGDVGFRKPEAISLEDGALNITGRDDVGGGVALQPGRQQQQTGGQQYGRWEIRARTDKGNGWAGVAILWPDSENFPEDGEVDFMEIPKGERSEVHFVTHYSAENQTVGKTTPGDFSQWHNFAVEWTPEYIAGFIDGAEVYRTDRQDVQPPGPMHLTLQLDPGPWLGWIPPRDASTPDEVKLQVDWVRIYSL